MDRKQEGRKVYGVNERTLERLRDMYPKGARVRLVHMEDIYRSLPEGIEGTVIGVDDIGTIHVNWDNGSRLGVAYGEDSCVRIAEHEGSEREVYSEGTVGIPVKGGDHVIARYRVKHYKEKSEHGINGGRISKLRIDINGGCTANYDRGWDIEPEEGTPTEIAYYILLEKYN